MSFLHIQHTLFLKYMDIISITGKMYKIMHISPVMLIAEF